jgi:RHS repeat-associated protein
MQAQQPRGDTARAPGRPASDGQVRAPSIQLPKGGGAIRGIGEKFAANPVTGTGAMSVPIATSPGRSGFGPQLSLSYDSGSGNGPFGFGWSLSLPAIARKTDKGLPQYRDGEESDVYVLSGAEDLVPVLRSDGTRFADEASAPGFVIHRYRPRVEGLFARIERWTELAGGTIYWRSISRDNITTLYGADDDSRVADPSPTGPARVFSWLICASYDDKGNAVLYQYAAESDQHVDRGQANERNRGRAANRYLKRIKYGNRASNRDHDTWEALHPAQLPDESWLFEVVFDYDESHYEPVNLDPTRPEAEQHHFVRASASVGRPWAVRPDPFSSYRAGFEVRTNRRCRRVLMFHHVPDLPTGEKGCGGLVRSTEFDYADLDYGQSVPIEDELGHQGSTRFASFIRAVTQSGYVRDESQPVVVRDGVEYATYLMKSLPPLEFEYSKASIQDNVRELDGDSLDNLPVGLDGTTYQWVDLDGEGVSGILTEQADAWFYKPNLGEGRFGPQENVAVRPSLAALSSGRQQLLDLAGDGQLDLVSLAGPTPGFFERTQDEDWEPFRAFAHLPNIDWQEPNLRFVDLNGDGHADVLVTEHDVFTWHPSLAEEGFGPARQVRQPLDEEHGPRLVLADGTQSIYLADMCGDGLADLVRIRNGAVCYWPNLGYGRFGAKVTMDNAPWFDNIDQFDQRRVRLADIDGSGTNDIMYLGRDGVRLYFNQSGNRWSAPRRLNQFPRVDNLSDIATADLLGNGTACLVWSSPLPGDARRPLRYIDLMGGQKPHLLVKTVNNLGAETRVEYAPSTKFYLQDKRDGKPWITRLPFPVHVVKRVETLDRISGNRFVTRYAYHHGYFDGPEREFRGFGMIEQHDTEEMAALTAGGTLPDATNIDDASHVPPLLTRTWFHTGAFLDERRISKQFEHEYYREGDAGESLAGLTDEQLRALLLDDTRLPSTRRLADGTRTPYTLSTEEVVEACRALKGAILRQETYALDGTDEADRPYSTYERSYTIELLQPRDGNKHAVFFTHAREQVDFHYERKLVDVNGRKRADPRVSHAVTLEVDAFGNMLRTVAIGYRRRDLPGVDAPEQKQTHLTVTVNRFANRPDEQDWYRVGLPVETRTYEIVKPPEPTITDTWIDLFPGAPIAALTAGLFPLDQAEPDAAKLWPYEKWDWRVNAAHAPTDTRLRLIEHVRTVYRRDDLAGPLALGEVQSLALPFESYKLAFTPDLAQQIFVDSGKLTATALNGILADEGKYVHSEGDATWWIPSGRMFFSPGSTDTSAQELVHARRHFFLPHRYRDPFHTDQLTTETMVSFDHHRLLVVETRDAFGNTVHAENDYRALAPCVITDPNGNRSEVAFDALGMVAGTAAMGKENEPDGQPEGDSLANFAPDPTPAELAAFIAQPRRASADPQESEVTEIVRDLLKSATTRLMYDLDRFRRLGEPPFAATIVREKHLHDLDAAEQSKVQVSFSYSDGFGREIQKKAQAEPGPLAEAGPEINPRWVGSGWTVFNNKGKPVRQYEPFFTDTHRFEFDVRIGVSPVLFYDPAERVVATLHPNHTWEKVVFDPWRQETWDVSDTVLMTDPKTDPDVGAFFSRLANADYLLSWHALRTDPAHALEASQRWPDPRTRDAEKRAAEKASVHAATPTVAHADSLGRTFLTVAHNKFKYSDTPPADPPTEELHRTRVLLDIEGNQRDVIDARDRTVMRYDYDLLGNRIHQASTEAGKRWILNDVSGQPIRAWDSRGHAYRTEYDLLRRPLRSFVTGADPSNPNQELLTERLVYGEQHPEAELRNLRGRPYLHLDQAGAATTEAHDFKGNPLRASRRLATAYKTAVDWSVVDAVLPSTVTATLNTALLEIVLASQLETGIFSTRTTYDALNRPVALRTPDNSVIRPGYNEANLLERMDVNLRGAIAGGQPVWTPFVTDINYDAKGQRQRIDYGNGVRTSYRYDPLTFRLVHLLTRRNAVVFPDDCPQPPPTGWPGCQVQSLRYTYDPAGNITSIRDDAQQSIYFRNRRVEPSAEHTYDAIYRLIEATGREHLGQIGGTPFPHSHDDAPRVGLLHPGDGKAMGTYTERYVYDAVGNFLRMQHRGSDPAQPGWTRTYAYDEASLIEPAKQSNRLSHTTVGNGNPATERYIHDAHGNLTRMPHLGGAHPNPNMHWDYRDQLRQTDLEGGGTAYYVYDAGGQRVRKVWEKAPGLTEERIYLGGFEVFRRRNGSGAVTLERETLHIMDDEQRIALLESRTLDTAGDDPAPPQLTRYQFGNHLGSASLELDDQAQIISYEEYTPYGSTSYQAMRSMAEVSLKRYRYTAKERDEETGLSYHRARYYSPAIGRWISPDPNSISSGLNLFAYTSGNPIRRSDPDGREEEEVDLGQAPDVQAAARAADAARPDLAQRPAPTIPAGLQVTYAVARRAASAGQRAFRRALGLIGRGGTIQAGHTMDVLSSVNTRLPPNVRDNPATMMALHSRIDPDLEVRMTTNAGEPGKAPSSAETAADSIPWGRPNTRHTGQEKLRGHLQSREANRTGGILTREGQVAASVNILNQTENTPWDQRNVDLVRSSPRSTEAQRIESSAAVRTYRQRPNAGVSVGASFFRTFVPGVFEAEVGLFSGAMYAYGHGYYAAGNFLMKGAARVPVVAAAAVGGVAGGNLYRAGAEKLGASETVAEGAGRFGAVQFGGLVGLAAYLLFD